MDIMSLLTGRLFKKQIIAIIEGQKQGPGPKLHLQFQEYLERQQFLKRVRQSLVNRFT